MAFQKMNPDNPWWNLKIACLANLAFFIGIFMIGGIWKLVDENISLFVPIFFFMAVIYALKKKGKAHWFLIFAMDVATGMLAVVMFIAGWAHTIETAPLALWPMLLLLACLAVLGHVQLQLNGE